MGGFRLVGPNYVISGGYGDGTRNCHCRGFEGNIDASTEKRLVAKRQKILDPIADLPFEIKSSMFGSHIDGWAYSHRQKRTAKRK